MTLKPCPREPTKEMLEAAAATPGMKAASDTMVIHQARGYGFAAGSFDDGSPLEQAWRAMFDAAPQVPLDGDVVERVARAIEPNSFDALGGQLSSAHGSAARIKARAAIAALSSIRDR